MSFVLAFALALAVQPAASPPPADVAKSSTVSGLTSSAQMTVRVVVVDRCKVTSTGATCEGAAPIRPLAVNQPNRASRIEVTF